MTLAHLRPTFDVIAAKLQKTSHLFEKNGQSNISMVSCTEAPTLEYTVHVLVAGLLKTS
jgi:hypothetical protein